MWNISNIISLSRIFLAIPVVIFILQDNILFAISFSILAMLTDYLDGYYARKLNQITEMGKILDPLADKIVITGAVVAMIITGKLSIYLAGGIVLRDLLILAGGLYTKRILGYVIPSNQLGKWTVTFLTYYLLFKLIVPISTSTLANIDIISIVFISLMLISSFVYYLITAVKLVRNKQNQDNSVLDT